MGSDCSLFIICKLVSDRVLKTCFLCAVWHVSPWQGQLHACVHVISPYKSRAVSDLKTEQLNSENGRIHLAPTHVLSHKDTHKYKQARVILAGILYI